MSTKPEQRPGVANASRPGAYPSPVVEAVSRHSRTLLAGLGVVTVLLGVAVLVWPKATLVVVAVLLAVQFLLGGVFQLIGVVTVAEGGGERAVLAVCGALSLLIALLVLRKPLQSLVLVTLLVGAWWIVKGVLDLVAAFPSGAAHRGWGLALGVISLVAGVFVILNPGISLVTFVWVTGLWMIAVGAVMVVAALAGRARS